MAIGQKLEEARNRKGISIREASESTKIRGDYLTSFESGNFDLRLPEVYLRGFIRVYARFLGIDPESAVSDLNTELGIKPNKTNRKNLGTIGSNESGENPREIKKIQPEGNLSRNSSSLKLVLLLSGGAILLIILFSLIIFAFSEGDDPNDATMAAAPKSAEVRETLSQTQAIKPVETPNEPSSLDKSVNRSLKLAAIGPIERLIISDEGKSPKVFHEYKNIKMGWETTVPFTESFRCYSSSLEHIRFAVDEGVEKQVSGNGAGNFRWNP
jgi:cytoskeleton protein RodZ